jgi:hypothetical protein
MGSRRSVASPPSTYSRLAASATYGGPQFIASCAGHQGTKSSPILCEWFSCRMITSPSHWILLANCQNHDTGAAATWGSKEGGTIERSVSPHQHTHTHTIHTHTHTHKNTHKHKHEHTNPLVVTGKQRVFLAASLTAGLAGVCYDPMKQTTLVIHLQVLDHLIIFLDWPEPHICTQYTVYIYGVFARDITKYTIIHGAYTYGSGQP